MNKSIILFSILLITVSVFANVIPFENLPYEFQTRAVPDMDGNVNVTGNLVLDNDYESCFNRDLPTVMEGFPVSYTVANCLNGVIYLNMDDDPEMEIVFGAGKKVVAVNLDGSAVPGWPIQNAFFIWSSPACGDIDGDGVMEIVATSRNNTNANSGELYAYELDGSPCTGFPVVMAGGGTMNACLSDIDDDEDMEIFVNVRSHPNGFVYAFQGDGTIIEGWPADLDYVPGASISVADLDNDGNKEVIALSYNSIYVFDAAGNVLPGWPFTEAGTTVSYSQPVLLDMDADGDLEILYGSCTDAGGKVFAFHHDGSQVTGWPQITANWVFATVAFGDIDADGELDVVVGDETSSNDAADYIYAWHLDGTPVPNFPAGPTFAIYTQCAIADLDGDGEVEIMIDDNRYGWGYEAYNHDGTHCEEWPLPCGTAWSSVSMQMTPVVGDFNADGILDIAGAATDLVAWVVEAYVWDSGIAWNEDLAYTVLDGYNVRHDGIYPAETQFVPLPPQNLELEIADYNSINASWEAPDGTTPLGYNIYRDGEFVGSITATDELNFMFDNLDTGSYEIGISAIYELVESEMILATISVNLGAPMITDFEVLPIPQVNLIWELPETRALENFIIYRDGVEIGQSTTFAYSDTEVENGVSYEYYITAVYSGDFVSEPSNTITVDVTDSPNAETPELTTKLTGNYPNPFNPQTSFSFNLKNSGSISLKIYNITGALVETIEAGTQSSGKNQINWNADGKASGIYFAQLIVDGKTYNKTKCLLIK